MKLFEGGIVQSVSILMRKACLAAAFAGVFSITPAQSQVTDTRMVAGWFLAKIKSERLGMNNCIASKTFSDGTKLELTFAVNGSEFHKMELENEDWTSLNSVELGGGGKPDPIMPLSISYGGTSEAPLTEDFRVSPKTMFNMKPKLWKSFKTDAFGGIVRNLAASNAIRVTSGDRVIGNWPMDGSKAAITALLQCAQADLSEQNRRLENDPFRK